MYRSSNEIYEIELPLNGRRLKKKTLILDNECYFMLSESQKPENNIIRLPNYVRL